MPGCGSSSFSLRVFENVTVIHICDAFWPRGVSRKEGLWECRERVIERERETHNKNECTSILFENVYYALEPENMCCLYLHTNVFLSTRIYTIQLYSRHIYSYTVWDEVINIGKTKWVYLKNATQNIFHHIYLDVPKKKWKSKMFFFSIKSTSML